MLSAILAFTVGLALLIKGADLLVEGASNIARRLRVSDLAIGLTIVAFGTSLPELTVNMFASVSGANDIAIGNIIGSNIANILFILGIAAAIAPMTVRTSTVWKEIPLSFLAAMLVLVMTNDRFLDHYPLSELSRSDGLALLGFFVTFLWYIAGMQRPEEKVQRKQVNLTIAAGSVTLGLLLLVGGGKIALDGAVNLATLFGVSQALIGLTVVALGTSLPELATSTVAAYKGKADIAVGNIVGSNIFNIFWILGLSATIRPLRFQPSHNIDIGVAILATVILFCAIHTGYVHRRIVFWRQREGHRLERADGLLMLALYVIYIGYSLWREFVA